MGMDDYLRRRYHSPTWDMALRYTMLTRSLSTFEKADLIYIDNGDCREQRTRFEVHLEEMPNSRIVDVYRFIEYISRCAGSNRWLP